MSRKEVGTGRKGITEEVNAREGNREVRVIRAERALESPFEGLLMIGLR